MNFEQSPIHEHIGHECPACGKNSEERWASESFIYGEGKDEAVLKVLIPKLYCSACGLVITDERAEVIRHEAVCAHLKILSPKEIVQIRNEHGLTQKEFAELSRIGRASLSRWEMGDVTQNGSTDNLVFLLSYLDNIERLKNRFKQEKSSVRTCAERGTEKFRCLNSEMVGKLSKRPKFALHPR